LPQLKSAKIVLHNDGRAGKVRYTLMKHAVSKWTMQCLPFPVCTDMAMEMLIPHPADIDTYLEDLLPAMPAMQTFECMFTDAKHPHDPTPAMHYRKDILACAYDSRSDHGNIAI
jgi:hypothetical protein